MPKLAAHSRSLSVDAKLACVTGQEIVAGMSLATSRSMLAMVLRHETLAPSNGVVYLLVGGV